MAERGYLIAGVHRGKNLLVSDEVADLLDPICRAEITRICAAARGWRRLLDHLAEAGPASIDDLRVELRLKRQELNALRAPLERCGAIIARSLQVTAGAGHLHSSELIRWDQAHPGLGGRTDPPQALAGLIAAGSARLWSRPSGSCAGGIPGSGTGRAGSSMAWSGTAGCGESMATSPRQGDHAPAVVPSLRRHGCGEHLDAIAGRSAGAAPGSSGTRRGTGSVSMAGAQRRRARTSPQALATGR